MKPYHKDNHVQNFNMHCLDGMAGLEPGSVQCVVTSPPYWGLREYVGEQDIVWGENHCEHEWSGQGLVSDVRKEEVIAGKSRTEDRFYGDESRRFDGNHQKHYQDRSCALCGAWKGAYGLEPTPEMYVQHTVEILRGIRRVLRKDGVVFWNVGDSYAGSGKGVYADGLSHGTDGEMQRTNAGSIGLVKSNRLPRGNGRWGGGNCPQGNSLKPKDLCLIPFRVAIAAQDDGWWVRSVIIWSKPNVMPQSVKDRPTLAHEYILMITKSARYYWDQEAVRESFMGKDERQWAATYKECGSIIQGETNAGIMRTKRYPDSNGRNLRSVWEFPTQPYPEPHFAVYPEALPERCIKAATSEKGNCSKCGRPWTRVTKGGFTDHTGETESAYPKAERSTAHRLAQLRQAARERGAEYANDRETVGWKPQCSCNADPVPAVVLDPFSGAGTTLWVAKKLGRRAIGFDISEEYCELALDRNRQAAMQMV